MNSPHTVMAAMTLGEGLLVALVGLAVGAAVVWFLKKSADVKKQGVAAAEAEALLVKARADAESIRKDAILAGTEEALQRREKTAAEEATRRRELQDLGMRLGRLEESLAERDQALEKKMRQNQELEKDIALRKTRIETKEKDIDAKLEEQKLVLTNLAGMTREE